MVTAGSLLSTYLALLSSPSLRTTSVFRLFARGFVFCSLTSIGLEPGRLVAMRIKRGALFSSAMQRLVNADRRMQHELDMQLSEADVQDRLSSLRLRTPTHTPPRLPSLRQQLTTSRHRSQHQMTSAGTRSAALSSASPSETVISVGDGEAAQPLQPIPAFCMLYLLPFMSLRVSYTLRCVPSDQ